MKKEKQAMASKTLTAFSGIKILDIVYDVTDRIKFCYYDDTNGDGKTLTSNLHYDGMCNPYFISQRNKYYINEFM